METKIKICGLKRTQDVDYINKYIPDYAGFVFAKSRRRIGREQAEWLRKRMDPRIQSVGVFVNAGQEEIMEFAEAGIIDLIQLHGDEPESYAKELRKRLKESGLSSKLIRAVRVREKEDIERAFAYPADFLLFDAYREGVYGGSGSRIADELLADLPKKALADAVPCFLAGGIHAGNIQELAEKYRPYCIDLSSGVETEGLKDEEKISQVMEKMRGGKGNEGKV